MSLSLMGSTNRLLCLQVLKDTMRWKKSNTAIQGLRKLTNKEQINGKVWNMEIVNETEMECNSN